MLRNQQNYGKITSRKTLVGARSASGRVNFSGKFWEQWTEFELKKAYFSFANRTNPFYENP
jgi:ABC-type cobalamin transport system ATPase subunit